MKFFFNSHLSSLFLFLGFVTAFSADSSSIAPSSLADSLNNADSLNLSDSLSLADSLKSDSSSDSALTSTSGSKIIDEIIQAKLDSLSRLTQTKAGAERNLDSIAKVKSDSIRVLLSEGKYVQRVKYDKSNFDHWKVDTVFQKQMKGNLSGSWRTPIVPHGHSFRDSELRFLDNDTLYGVTRTYSDSGRYQMTGEYAFYARYRFENDSTIVSREVFSDRNVVRWDFILFKIIGNKMTYHLKKLEFRDLNDNWLNALQGFDHVAPEVYYRDQKDEKKR